MRNLFFAIGVLFSVLIIAGAGRPFYKKPLSAAPYEKTDIIGCAPAATGLSAAVNGKFIPVMPGLGHHSYSISTKNDSTQFYFNQGLNFYYSYHLKEAVASFKEAARFDNTCAMAYWG